jgi:hypothetical protein
MITLGKCTLRRLSINTNQKVFSKNPWGEIIEKMGHHGERGRKTWKV